MEKNKSYLTIDIHEDLKEAIDKIIDKKCSGLLGCVGESAFSELVTQGDYDKIALGEKLLDLSEEIAGVITRLDDYYKENY